MGTAPRQGNHNMSRSSTLLAIPPTMGLERNGKHTANSAATLAFLDFFIAVTLPADDSANIQPKTVIQNFGRLMKSFFFHSLIIAEQAPKIRLAVEQLSFHINWMTSKSCRLALARTNSARRIHALQPQSEHTAFFFFPPSFQCSPVFFWGNPHLENPMVNNASHEGCHFSFSPPNTSFPLFLPNLFQLYSTLSANEEHNASYPRERARERERISSFKCQKKRLGKKSV